MVFFLCFWLRCGGRGRDQWHKRTQVPAVTRSRSRCLRTQFQAILKHEPEAKRRKLANVHRNKARFTHVLRMQKYDGSLQKMTKMLLDLEFDKTRDDRENVTSIIEKLSDRKEMCTRLDDDAKWAGMFRDTLFVDDVNGGNVLDKHLVIEARKRDGVHQERHTDKGHRWNADCRSRLVALKIKKDNRQANIQTRRRRSFRRRRGRKTVEWQQRFGCLKVVEVINTDKVKALMSVVEAWRWAFNVITKWSECNFNTKNTTCTSLLLTLVHGF